MAFKNARAMVFLNSGLANNNFWSDAEKSEFYGQVAAPTRIYLPEKFRGGGGGGRVQRPPIITKSTLNAGHFYFQMLSLDF